MREVNKTGIATRTHEGVRWHAGRRQSLEGVKENCQKRPLEKKRARRLK